MREDKITIRRIPQHGWAVYDNGIKVLPPTPHTWYANRRSAVAALAEVAVWEPSSNLEPPF